MEPAAEVSPESYTRAMNKFVRIIFTILCLSIVAGLTVVMVANARSTRDQNAQVALETRRFEDLLRRLDGRFRRAEMVVDWQKLDAEGTVTETGLLVRQFVLHENDETPLHVQRVVIPGSEMRVDGLLLEFGAEAPEDFAAARQRRIVLFAHVFGGEQPPASRFTFLPANEVPLAARVHMDRVTHHETVFWNYVWDRVQEQEKNGKAASLLGVRATWLPAASRGVRRGLLYTAILTTEGVTIQETDDRRTVNEIRTDAERGSAESRPG
jgi:hypothetical protein